MTTRVEECSKPKIRLAAKNTVYLTIEAVNAYATLDEIFSALQKVYGTHRNRWLSGSRASEPRLKVVA